MGELGAGEPPMEAFFRVFHGLPRQGPGSDEVAASVLSRIAPLLPSLSNGEPARCADMGCGSGRSALVIASQLAAHVTAVDLYPPFLDMLRQEAIAKGVAEQIVPLEADMLDCGLAAESLDLVWSEGAAFAVGFDVALDCWKGLLRPGGVLVVSECSWLTSTPSASALSFWRDAYPDMRTVGENISAADQRGFNFVHAEVLPDAAWEEEYYQPLEQRIQELQDETASDPHLRAVIAGVKAEIRTYRHHCDCYGYVFYVFRRGCGA